MTEGEEAPHMAAEEKQVTGHQQSSTSSAKLWILISAMALAFLLYGIMMFYVVGDKGPPDWDFGVVQDIPGKSQFSTFSGKVTSLPEEQHVADRPLQAEFPTQEKGQ